MKEGDLAKVKKLGKRLIIEPRNIADYEIFTNRELKEMLKEDELPKKLQKKALSFWRDVK